MLSPAFARAGLAVCVLAASLASPLHGHGGHTPPPTGTVTGSHGADLSPFAIDVLDSGTVVVTLQATGELAGALTLNLTPAADGSYSGDWALLVESVDSTDPETGVEPEAHAEGGEPHAHKDFMRLVRRGTIGGAISHATLAFDANGLADLAATLSLDAGTQEFDGATGSGTATLSTLALTY